MSMNKIYKRGQGKNTRLVTGGMLVLIVAVGCYRLYESLAAVNSITIQTLVPSVVLLAFGVFVFWLMNKPSIADFLIQAEGEIKKVSWSTRKEIISSTVIVVVVVAIFATGLFLVDMGFIGLFSGLLKLY